MRCAQLTASLLEMIGAPSIGLMLTIRAPGGMVGTKGQVLLSPAMSLDAGYARH